MLVIMHAITKWQQYMLSMKFMILTNHNSLQHLLQQNMLTTQQHKWINKISTFDMEILHKKFKDIILADTLSRKYEVHVYAISMVVP